MTTFNVHTVMSNESKQLYCHFQCIKTDNYQEVNQNCFRE